MYINDNVTENINIYIYKISYFHREMPDLQHLLKICYK